MITKLKTMIMTSASTLMLMFALAVPVTAAAACSNTATNIAEGANAAASSSSISCDSPNNATSGVKTLAANIVNVFSIVVGITAVIMIIYGGFRYITSGGDSGNVGSAKNTLIYAIVGLIIVALAQVIVHFVLSASSTATTL